MVLEAAAFGVTEYRWKLDIFNTAQLFAAKYVHE
jgi:hypothetical protein